MNERRTECRKARTNQEVSKSSRQGRCAIGQVLSSPRNSLGRSERACSTRTYNFDFQHQRSTSIHPTPRSSSSTFDSAQRLLPIHPRITVNTWEGHHSQHRGISCMSFTQHRFNHGCTDPIIAPEAASRLSPDPSPPHPTCTLPPASRFLAPSITTSYIRSDRPPIFSSHPSLFAREDAARSGGQQVVMVRDERCQNLT